MKFFLAILLLCGVFSASANLEADIQAIEPDLIEWRRHLHQHPELSNREFETAKYIAQKLKSFGLEVETGIAHTGVVGVLKGELPGPTLALRADMDALPVTEATDLPFASKATATYRGETTGVMHACGHDAHMAIQLATAAVLAQNKDRIKGTLVFVFQPAEEGAPKGEEGGAELMLAEGLFDKHKPEAIFGLHVWAPVHAGVVGLRSGPMMAAVDDFELRVIGKQTHGSRPWGGVDPIVTSAQIINAVQTIISRRTDITKAPAVVSFGAIKGGIRNNIIPDAVTMVGTIRNFDMATRDNIHQQLHEVIEHVAAANGATVEFKINEGYPVTANDPELTARLLPSLKKVFGENQVKEAGLITGAEDFSFFANEIPGLYFFIGVTPKDQDLNTVANNHSPNFFIDESALLGGVKAMVQLVQDY